MYGPAPARAKKTNIVRTRSGCAPCRQKRRKCDEARPSCRRCTERGQACSYGVAWEFRDATRWAAQRVRAAKTPAQAHPSPRPSISVTTPDALQTPRPSGASWSPSSFLLSSDLPVYADEAMSGSALQQSICGLDEAGALLPAFLTDSLAINAASSLLLFGFDSSDDSVLVPDDLDWPPPSGSQSSSSFPSAACSTDAVSLSPPLSTLVVRDRMYLAHFSVMVLDTLPGKLQALHEQTLHVMPVRHAAMSLAAASLANLHGHHEASEWVPNSLHVGQALKHASKASDAMRNSSPVPPDMAVATALLLMYMKVDLGTIESMCSHFLSLEKTVLLHEHSLATTELGLGLLRSYLHARALYRSMCAPYRSFRGEAASDCMVAPLAKKYGSYLESIELLSCDAIRIIGRILLYECMHATKSSPKTALQKMLRWHSIVKGVTCSRGDDIFGGEFQTVFGVERSYEELRSLREQLQACDPPPGIPSFAHASSSHQDMSADLDSLEPLHFEDCDAAMRCAYYAFAQVVCDDSLVQNLLRPPSSTSSTLETLVHPHHHWLHMMLRIAAGLDPEEYARENAYRQGMTYLLVMATMLSGDVRALGFTGQYIARSSAAGVARDGAYYPLPLAQMSVQVLQRERNRGRLVFWMATTHKATAEVRTLMSLQTHEYMIVHGRTAAGQFFTDCVPLVEGAE